MSIDTAISIRMTGYAGLSALVSTRIYRPPIPQNPTYPLVTFQEVSDLPIKVMGGNAGIRHARYQVDCWATTIASAKAIAVQVAAALDNYAGTSDGIVIKNCFLEVGTQMYYTPDEGVHRYMQEYVIEYVG